MEQIFIAYCTGNIIGPQLFLQREYPTYKTGFLAIMICYVIGLIGSLLLRANLVWENERRDCEQQLMSSGERVVKDIEDQTDKQLTQFRYIY